MNGTARRLALLTCAATLAFGLAAQADAPAPIVCEASAYVPQSLSGAASASLPATPLLRFAQLSDTHLTDDEASPVINGNWLEAVLEPAIGNNSASRLQEEYTDEVLNAMELTVNTCDAQDDIAFMVATGDLTDNMTLNELRRYIDNLDGVAFGDTAYEANCGYTTRDSNGKPKLGAAPCTAEMQDAFVVPTGKLVPDAQSSAPDPDDPTYQLTATRSARQIAEEAASSAAGLSHWIAPGLPPVLRCDADIDGCANHRLAVPHYAVFGNHDGSVRGTVTMQQAFQAGPAAVGRYFLESQREFINEWFYTRALPGPVGHGFAHAGARLDDADDRNDGWYAFDAGAGAVRVVVLNTIYDGVEGETHRDGQTGSDTGGLVAGNEVTNPIGLEMGAMNAKQFAWLEAELAAASKPVLVFSHHPDRSFSERRLGFAADRGKTADQLDNLLGKYGNVVAHIAGHTHENIVRACKPGPGGCPIGNPSSAMQPNVAHGFWRVETASLIDYPQEGRIVELFDLANGASTVAGRYAIRLTMLSPDPNDPISNLSHELSKAEATCTTSSITGGPASSGPYNQDRLEELLDNAGEAAVQGKFCQGEASLAASAGKPTDRDTTLYP